MDIGVIIMDALAGMARQGAGDPNADASGTAASINAGGGCEFQHGYAGRLV
tara:strand:+ start:2416 stop:2568 length:153 start_codon:yes stop_codon:yes gene_type:complete